MGLEEHHNNNEIIIDNNNEDDPLPLEGHFLAGVGPGAVDEEYSSSSNKNPNKETSSTNHLLYPLSSSSSSSHDGDSSCRCNDENDDTSAKTTNNNNTTTPPAARIFYFIGIHNERTLQDAGPLFRSIKHSNNIVLFHFDTKFGVSSYYNNNNNTTNQTQQQSSSLRTEIEQCACGTNVKVASLYNCSWGTWSMVQPTLWSIEQATTIYAGQWDVYINLSGDTLPVYTQKKIASLFSGPLQDMNFVTSEACETGLRPTPITYFPPKCH